MSQCIGPERNGEGVRLTGHPSRAELAASPGMPDAARFEAGPVAVIECVQAIPCNPCEKACPFGAIRVGQPITNLPELDGSRCIGCGACIASCPGLAIFRVHQNYTDTTSLVEFPYEYLPAPRKGQTVPCAGRDGAFLVDGRVMRVSNPARNDGTMTVSVEVPKAYGMQVRSILRKERP